MINEKITTIKNELTSQEELINQITNTLNEKTGNNNTLPSFSDTTLKNNTTLLRNVLTFTNSSPEYKEFTTEEQVVDPGEKKQEITPVFADGLSKVTVNAIDSNYLGSGIIKKEAEIFIPTTTDQIISANQYLNGIQTIKGDDTLVPENILIGKQIFNVTGNVISHEWMTGTNPVLLDQHNQVFTLAETDFVIGETASQTETIILDSKSNLYSYQIPTGKTNNDIVVVQTCISEPIHDQSAVQKHLQIRFIYKYLTFFAHKATSDSGTLTTGWGDNHIIYYINRSYNSTGTIVRGVPSEPSGFYCTGVNAAIKGSTISVNSPILKCRVANGYESTANMKLVTDCNFTWKVDVYAVDQGSSLLSRLIQQIQTDHDDYMI